MTNLMANQRANYFPDLALNNTNKLPSLENKGEMKFTVEQIRKKAQEFEAVYLANMFEIMFKEVKLNPLGEDSGANKIYKSLMVEKIAGKVSEVSQLGIADLVLDTLLRNQEVK